MYESDTFKQMVTYESKGKINDLNILISDKDLAGKIKSNEVFLDDKKKFSRIK